jgi:NADPH:quinone reductase-like Zn-dependent oxidoreductase
VKAIVWTRYGPPDVLQLEEVEKPTPKENEVLIRIHATTVTAGDCEVRKLDMPMFLGLPMRAYVGLTRPKRIRILGQELAGEVESTGRAVSRFKKGDQVFAGTDFSMGAYAEYICLPEDSEDVPIAPKPTNMTYEEAATVPLGGLEALRFIRAAGIRSGERVLVNGAGGSIGAYAVQLAKSHGAEVTVVDSAEKLDMLRSIGADHVVDFGQQDFTTRGETYDVIFDVVGKAPYSRSLATLNERGRLLLANPRLSLLLRGRWTAATGTKRVLVETSGRTTEDLLFLKGLIEAGQLKAVVGKRYPLEAMVEAHRYVEAGHKQGDLVINVTPAATKGIA